MIFIPHLPGGPGCTACGEAGEKGCCARLRCYCGHPECWAYHTYHMPEEQHTVQKISGKKNHLKPPPAGLNSSTWTDKY